MRRYPFYLSAHLATAFLGVVVLVCLQFSPVEASGRMAANDSSPLSFMASPPDTSGAPAPLSIVSTSPDFTHISLDNPNIVVDQHVIDFHTYQTFTLAGEPFVMGEGDPMVPQVVRFYRIPNTGGVDLEVTPGDYDLLEDVDPLPVKFTDEGFGAVEKSSVYERDQWYPSTVAEMSAPMVMRDMRMVRVVIYPVQVNPVTHQARIYRNISANVVANGQPGENEITHARTISADWVPLYRQMISNLDESALTDVSTMPGGILILSYNNAIMNGWSDSLATWKRRKGYNVTVDSRTSWTSTQARQAILTAYQTWDPPLEYAILMGDPGWTGYGIPVYPSASPTCEFDHAYASLTSGDEIEDIGVGRLSGSSDTYMGVINTKIMRYEREPHMQTGGGVVDTTWYHKAFLYAGIAGGCAGNYLLMRWGQDQFVRNTGVDMVTVDQVNGSVNQTTIINQINAGTSFFLWRGAWEFEMPTNMANLTSPGDRFPVTMTVTCAAGDYYSNGINSPAEGWLCYGTVASPKGGICGLGTSTIGTSNGANVVLAGGFIYNITDAGVDHLGVAVAGAKAALYAAFGPTFPDPDHYVYSSGPIALHFTRYFNLLGDPSLDVWTGVPKELTVSHPATLNVGAHSMSLDVTETATGLPVADAVVCLWKGTETYERHLTDANGHVQMPISINTAGDLLVTVTKHDYKPYLATVTCSSAAQYIALSSYIVDDDNNGNSIGNGDHVVNPGETIELPLYLRNYGTSTTATSVSAVMTSSNPRVAVVSGSSTFPNLAPGDSGAAVTTYRVQVSPLIQNREEALLTLTVTASSIQTISTIMIVAHSGEPVYISHAFTGTVTPGSTNDLQVTLQNVGSVTLTGATGQLMSLTPYVQVSDPIGTYGNIASGAQASNSGDPYTVTSSPVAFPGMQAPLRVIVSTSNGFQDTIQFNASIGTAASTDPTGPDTYGYYAYDNTDANYPHPTYNYVNISSGGGTNLNLSDPGDKTTPSPVYSAWIHLPFGFKFYGQVYDTLTVCSNGWCAFGNQSYIDMFRNYAIPSMGAPDALIAPYWDDLKTNGGGQGVWYMNDASNHRFIVQWKAGAGSSYSTPLDFEVILYDTTYTPTPTGNGLVEMQYNTVTMNLPNYSTDEAPGCTIGIQMPGNTIGLGYVYGATYSSGAATVVSGRAIRFTAEGPPSPIPSISVVTPNGDESWFIGQPYNILWSSTAISGNVNISLNRNYPGGGWESLFSNTADDGVQQWTVTGSSTTNSARIRVISVSDPSVGDTSDANFTLQTPSVSIITPNGGEALVVGTQHNMQWTVNGVGATTLSLNRNYPGGSWEVLSAGSGTSFLWSVTGPPSSNVRIRVVSDALPSIGDTSDANFSIGAPPLLQHDPHPDQTPGTATFVAHVTDDLPGFTTKLFYRPFGAAYYDSLILSATGNPDEYAVTTPPLVAGTYQYYLRTTDAQDLSAFSPVSGAHRFDIGPLGENWMGCDDGTAENYNWVNGPGFKWAVKFVPTSFPFGLAGARFAICPTCPTAEHDAVIVNVYLADGPNGFPGTIVYADTTGPAGNIVGGLPTGAAWADVVIRVDDQSLILNEAFFISVQNTSPRVFPVAFGLDTNGVRCHMSYFWDACEQTWYNEDDASDNARPGNRMISANGFALTPPIVVVHRSGNGIVLDWDSTGAPHYRVYIATSPNGPFDTVLGSTTSNTFTDTNAVNLNIKRFYQVVSTDTP